jgi:DNA-binding NarL/FixJ family response regulator
MRLLLVGEHVLLLQGLAKLLHDQTGAEIRATVRRDEAEDALRHWRPDVVVAETSDMSAAGNLIEHLHTTADGLPLVVIAPGDRAQFLAALRAGARGFVGRDASAEQLLGCIDAVCRGEWGLPRGVIGYLVEEYLALSAAQRPPARVELTQREQQIVRLLARGLSTDQIGRELYLSESTVRAHIRALAQKLGVVNRVQAVHEALRRGLVTPD